MKAVLLDTDYVIDYLRGKENVRELIFELLSHGTAFLSMLTVYELYTGMFPNEEQVTENFIKGCGVLPVTFEIAKNAGIFGHKCRSNGITLSVVDCIIRETARSHSLVLATNNKKHYPDTNFLDH